jgi:hypothetical protein
MLPSAGSPYRAQMGLLGIDVKEHRVRYLLGDSWRATQANIVAITLFRGCPKQPFPDRKLATQVVDRQLLRKPGSLAQDSLPPTDLQRQGNRSAARDGDKDSNSRGKRRGWDQVAPARVARTTPARVRR